LDRFELAGRLLAASDAERGSLLLQHSAIADLDLARALKEICYDAWQTAPTRSVQAAAAIRVLANQNSDADTLALADWLGGIASLVEGKMEAAIVCLNAAETRLLSLNKQQDAAATRVSKLIALATLGRYDEAVECGLQAREVLLAHGDEVAAGRIEHNIGNIHFRRDRYQEAETFQRSAHERFLKAGDQVQLTKIENSLALTLAQQHKIHDAEALYQKALERAQLLEEIATQAAIESSIGMLAFYEAKYDRALDFLERSRRKYVTLNMPHLAATAELEIADVYLELNLAPEASEIYDRVTSEFERLEMRAEKARALVSNAKAVTLIGQTSKAQQMLRDARSLYELEENDVGVATVALAQAQVFYDSQDYAAARETALLAAGMLADASSRRHALFSRWLAGEATRACGDLEPARDLLHSTLAEAESEEQPELVARCHTSLGLLSETPRDHFLAAADQIERLRAPLPSEEFRTAFFATKLTPYLELAQLSLNESVPAVADAFDYIERAKSRALADAMGNFVPEFTPRDPFEQQLCDRLEALSHELNYFNSRINHLPRDHEVELTELQQQSREREKEILEISRQLQHRSARVFGSTVQLDLSKLQTALGDDTVLIEYATIGGELIAFAVMKDLIDVFRTRFTETEVTSELESFRFQIDTLRYGSKKLRKHLPTLVQRTQRHLERLYDLLLRPIESGLEHKRIVIVPHRALHYVPFHALHDGDAPVIARREVTYSPSALVLQQCLARPLRNLSKALLVGTVNQQTPRVGQELANLKSLFASSETLLNQEATLERLRHRATAADILHLACHGAFRRDNPLFSSLQLGHELLTVRDACRLKLDSPLVTLSACETGVNAIAPGEEIVGLARGFFSAGARSLLLSLWTVDDEATAELMADFYRHALASESLSGALRKAQLNLMARQPHPFFWSPFMLVGAW
jgi:tetratricopeptide (TPR) repeat protein